MADRRILVSLDEPLLGHPEDFSDLTPGKPLLSRPRDELVPTSWQAGLFGGKRPEFVSNVHIGSVTELTQSNKVAKLSYMNSNQPRVGQKYIVMGKIATVTKVTAAKVRYTISNEAGETIPFVTPRAVFANPYFVQNVEATA